MSYINYIEHPTFGRVWYRAHLRNWCVLGHSAKQNRAIGPLVEAVAIGYLVCGGGKTLDHALERLVAVLDLYAENGESLPIDRPRPMLTRLRTWFGMWRLNRRLKRRGMKNPVAARATAGGERT